MLEFPEMATATIAAPELSDIERRTFTPATDRRWQPEPGKPVPTSGLFSGTCRFEAAFAQHNHRPVLLCEIDGSARAVAKCFAPDLKIDPDIRTLEDLPMTTCLVAGFPCQDLSPAGHKEGIEGAKSSLVKHVFRLLSRTEVEWVILENVPYMLELDDGTGIKVVTQYLEHLGYRWAYRVVDSAHFGVPQRRLRVFIVASLHYDPREVLLSDDCGVPPARRDNSQQIDESASIGFFWTEGLTGLGLGIDVVPPLKAGSTIGLPSAPAILLPDGTLGTPHIEDAERLQGMPAGWTKPGETVQRNSRWRLVGSAVTTQVASWIADRIHDPKPYDSSRDQYVPLGGRYPRKAAWNMGNGVFAADVSANPLAIKAPPLQDFLTRRLEPLSERATAGFLERAKRGRLRFPPNFLQRVEAHLDRMRQGSSGQLALFS